MPDPPKYRALTLAWSMPENLKKFEGNRHGGGTSGESERLSSAPMRSLEIGAPPAKACGVVEIEVSGARIRVELGVELATLLTVLSALRDIR